MQYEKGDRPEVGVWDGFHSVRFWVGNALQASHWYCTRFGFKPYAYRGLETGHRDTCRHVIRNGNVFFVFESSYNPGDEVFGKHMQQHGDGVKDVSFVCDDVKAIFDFAVSKGARVVREPWEESDEHGTVKMATIATYGDTEHTIIEKSGYKGDFLPGYRLVDADQDPVLAAFECPKLNFIDHVVGNQPDQEMTPVAEWYEDKLGFSRFWSVDDKMIHTEYSSLRSIVMADFDRTIKMPINEPAAGKRKSQIQEYVDFYGGPGVQHIALSCSDIIQAVSAMRKRGLKFLEVPQKYYDNLKERLAQSPVNIKEDMKLIQENHILIDFDDKGYLLQIFSKPCEDRPTLFIEIIQRANHEGFGAGNFKSLFEALEQEQAKRGNL